ATPGADARTRGAVWPGTRALDRRAALPPSPRRVLGSRRPGFQPLPCATSESWVLAIPEARACVASRRLPGCSRARPPPARSPLPAAGPQRELADELVDQVRGQVGGDARDVVGGRDLDHVGTDERQLPQAAHEGQDLARREAADR